MGINFELYKVFYYVAQDLNFSQASAKLFISQSAVSQAIKQLEEKLNCRLFFRNTKRVRLTQEGELLFKHIEQAFHLIKSGERSLQEIHSLEQGEIRIAASDTICKYYLLPYFKKFNQLYPKIKLRVINRTSPICMELLHKGSVDVGVINIPDKLPQNMSIKTTKTIQDVFIAGINFKHLSKKEIALKALKNYPLLLLEKKTVTRDFFDAFAKKNGVNVTPEIELGSLDLLVELTKIGLGIAFVIKDFIEEELANGDVFILNLQEKIPKRHLGIIAPDQVPLPIAVQKFIQLLEQ